MAVTVYKSTDGSAPALSGSTNTLISVLDACLVNGYGSKTAAGWAKSFAAGSDRGVYRPAGGNRFYLDVIDNGPGAGGFREARMMGFETVSAIGATATTNLSTGTGPFPTSAQSSVYIVARKSTTSDATARPWIVIADDRTMYLFMNSGDASPSWLSVFFGDFYSYLSGTDNYRTFISGRTVENSAPLTNDRNDMHILGLGTQSDKWIARAYTGTGGSIVMANVGDASKSGQSSSPAPLIGSFALPHVIDGNAWISPVFVCENVKLRGKMRGFYHYLHTLASFADQDTLSGAGVYAGRTFLLLKSPNGGAFCIDITGPWDAN